MFSCLCFGGSTPKQSNSKQQYQSFKAQKPQEPIVNKFTLPKTVGLNLGTQLERKIGVWQGVRSKELNKTNSWQVVKQQQLIDNVDNGLGDTNMSKNLKQALVKVQNLKGSIQSTSNSIAQIQLKKDDFKKRIKKMQQLLSQRLQRNSKRGSQRLIKRNVKNLKPQIHKQEKNMIKQQIGCDFINCGAECTKISQ